MPIREYVQHDDLRFRVPVVDVPEDKIATEDVLNLIQDMIDTHFQDNEKVGVGLAANQIGGKYRIFLTYINDARAQRENCEPMPLTFRFNTSIFIIDDELAYAPEGCFSVTGRMAGKVPRYKKIQITGLKASVEFSEGRQISKLIVEPCDEVYEGFPARLLQHESDHVNAEAPCFYYDHIGGFDHTEPVEAIGDPRTRQEVDQEETAGISFSSQ